jgi:SAM-dependent methyltransferase
MARDWNEHYASDELPWDSGRPAAELVGLVEAGRLPMGRALDIGCGTGTNVRYLSSLGYDAVGIDLAALAIERARAAVQPTGGGSTDYHVVDFLHGEPPGGPFDLVFDRGCFHVFDDAAEQALFARRVAVCLAPEGLWVSLLGSTEGPERDHGPPRRSARDIANAVEPALEVVELSGVEFDVDSPGSVRGWVLVARRRAVPAQPSSVQDGAPDLGSALAFIFSELVDGPPRGQAYMLNQGDEGLIRSLERVDWKAASHSAVGGAPIAQHVEHLRYGLSLMNRWVGGEENPFEGADWGQAWTTSVASDEEWADLRAALAAEAAAWKAQLGAVGAGAGMPERAIRGLIGSVAHLAYHMGAIRQIDRGARGPTDAESQAWMEA